MHKYILSIALFINSIYGLNAQNSTDAETIINKFIVSVQSEAIGTDFTFIISEKNTVNSQNFSGTFTLKGNQFYLQSDEMQVWFDGKTQWAYLEGNNEVSITEPTESELVQINPVAILSGFRSVSNIRFGKQQNAKNHIIELIPKNKKAEFSLVEVQIDKTTGNLYSILIRFQNGVTNQLFLKNYRKHVNITRNTFIFDKSKFKDVIVNDLR